MHIYYYLSYSYLTRELTNYELVERFLFLYLATPEHMGKTIIFDSSNDQELFMKDFLSPSDMQEKFDSWRIINNFDTKNILLKKNLINELVLKGFAKKEAVLFNAFQCNWKGF